MRSAVTDPLFRCLAPASALAAALLLAPATTRAETLADAIAQAYQSNPSLLAQRSSLRITDEAYVQARAGYRPQLNAEVDATRQDVLQQTTNAANAFLTLTQPLYTGGRTAAAVSAAEADILSGRETLRLAEESLLQSVIQAYADVLRDEEGVTIRQKNLTAGLDQLKEVKARTRVGDLTRTDTAQSQAYVNQAKIDLANAKAQLEVSRDEYLAIVGVLPGTLAPLADLPNMPATLNQAIATAEAANPALRAAFYIEAGARKRVDEARSQRMPTLSLKAQLGYTGPVSPYQPNIYAHEVLATATVVQPLFAGGAIESQVRQQIERQTSARIQIDLTRRQMVQQLGQSWAQYMADKENLSSAQEAVSDNQTAYEGVQKESRAGLRSTLEVLSIEQNLRDSELLQSSIKHDTSVLAAQVLSAMGLLDVRLLAPNIAAYRPEKSFNAVKNKGSIPTDSISALLDNIGASPLHRLPPPPQAPVPAPPTAGGG
jgi:outer membrane protein